MKRLERIHFLSRADALKPLRDLLRQLIAVHAYSEQSLAEIVLGVNEACMNVIQHAYGNRSDEEVIIEICIYNEGLQINIVDFAQKLDPVKIKSRQLDDIRPGGLGVHLISQLMDEVDYTHQGKDTGNILKMRKKFDNKAT